MFVDFKKYCILFTEINVKNKKTKETIRWVRAMNGEWNGGSGPHILDHQHEARWGGQSHARPPLHLKDTLVLNLIWYECTSERQWDLNPGRPIRSQKRYHSHSCLSYALRHHVSSKRKKRQTFWAQTERGAENAKKIQVLKGSENQGPTLVRLFSHPSLTYSENGESTSEQSLIQNLSDSEVVPVHYVMYLFFQTWKSSVD